MSPEGSATNLRKLIAMFRARRRGDLLGDVAALKIDALSAPPKGINEKLRGLRGYAPARDLATLQQLPPGSFGREYADFLERNGLELLQLSPALVERFRDNPYVLRYALTHDLHHVLTGFDTGIAGEIGVHAFAVAQGSGAGGRTAVRLARLFYPLLSPSQTRRIWHNIRVGQQLGRRAELLLAQRLESRFPEPLARVREQLGLPTEPAAAGVVPSGRSLLAAWIHGPPKSPTLARSTPASGTPYL